MTAIANFVAPYCLPAMFIIAMLLIAYTTRATIKGHAAEKAEQEAAAKARGEKPIRHHNPYRGK